MPQVIILKSGKARVSSRRTGVQVRERDLFGGHRPPLRPPLVEHAASASGHKKIFEKQHNVA